MFTRFSQITVVNVAAVIAFVELAERFSVRFNGFFFFVNLILLSSQFYGRLFPRRFYYVCNILLIAFSVS